MVCVGIDVAKDKHDFFILCSEGEVLADVFAIPNNRDGFVTLLQRIHLRFCPTDNIKIGLEATGHYSCNILRFLLDRGLPTDVINPLHTTSTGKVSACERQRLTALMHGQFRLCSRLMWTSSPTQIQYTTTRN